MSEQGRDAIDRSDEVEDREPQPETRPFVEPYSLTFRSARTVGYGLLAVVLLASFLSVSRKD